MFNYTKEVNSCLLKIQQGDKEQLGQLFNITANHLRGVAVQNLINKNNIDDVVSEVYIKVYTYINSYRNGENGYNWMCKIAENIARNMNTKQARTAIADAKFIRNIAIENECKVSSIDIIEFMSQFDKLCPKDQIIAYRWLFLDELQHKIAKNISASKAAVCMRIKKIAKFVDNLQK